MIDVASLKLKTVGKWFSIFESLGIDVRSDNKHSGCPICGPGNNAHRFRCDNKDNSGSWICTQCGSGDGTKLVQKAIGLNFKQAAKRILEVIGEGKTYMNAPQKPKMDEVKIKEFLNKIWNESVPLTGSCPVSKYLHARKLALQPENTRFCAECYESDTKQNYPAMVARFVTKDNIPTCLHRTYLQGNQKADIKSNKKMTPTIQPMAGGAVRLFSPDHEMFESGVLGIGEGIESSVAAAQIHGIAVWATLSTSLMESFEPPPEFRKIVIFADNDASFVGQKAAYTLANKLYKKDLIVSVEIPQKQGQDFCDVLIGMTK